MSKKTFLSARACRMIGGLAFSLAVGFSTQAYAQDASNFWATSFTFSGSGNIDVSSATSSGNYEPSTVSFNGTGEHVSVFNGSQFDVTSTIHGAANVSLNGASPFNVTLPDATELSLTTPTYSVDGSGDPPFFDMFPPPNGTTYDGSVASTQQHDFDYTADSTLYHLFVKFNGPASLTLGDEASVSVASGDIYTYTYTDTTLTFTGTVGENDPPITYTGTFTFTATGLPVPSVPDQSSGILGATVLLGLCVVGAHKKLRAA